MIFSSERLKSKAVELGFNIVGITHATPSPTLDAYFAWIEADRHGKMGYMARPDRQDRRRDLNVILPNTQSMILVGLDYRTLTISSDLLEDPSRGRISSYAWGVDYHDVMTPRLEQLAQWIKTESSIDLNHRVYVDTGAILERSHAQQANMGFIGKNTMLINPRRGSYFFLGEILADLEFDTYDTPHKASMCGNCTRCLTACPTNAFPKPYVLDAQRCISYLTIENKGWIDHNLRPLIGNWVYGCDICQEVCPWQRFSIPTDEQTFYPPNPEYAAPKLLDLLQLTTDTFREIYKNSPIYRIRRHRLVRNACIAVGNWGDETSIPILKTLLDDEHPIVRGHAGWALSQIMGIDAHSLLKSHYEHEPDDDVKIEIERLLSPS